jgi:membrane-anchored mycosin MYCP
VNAIPQSDGVSPIDGTSFASAYVTGLAALVRARFPQFSAGQVIERIERTAHSTGDGHDDRVGAGLIDPTAALTAAMPDVAAPSAGVRIAASSLPPAPDPWPRRIGVAGALACLGLLGLFLAVSIPFRRKRRDDPFEELP